MFDKEMPLILKSAMFGPISIDDITIGFPRISFGGAPPVVPLPAHKLPKAKVSPSSIVANTLSAPSGADIFEKRGSESITAVPV